MAHRSESPAAARQPNRLAGQTSPYLLQHAYNPVQWWPWGPEAFAEARRREVPVFLSIGYSTCYWCHVMERESFESHAIARAMNDGFVCIKVDREERPDVDDLYMAAVQAFSGHGGWPMSVFLEPKSLRPFWAGTYFPPEPKYAGMPSFPQVLGGISQAWREQREEVFEQADQLAEAVRERVAAAAAPVRIGDQQVTDAVGAVLRMFDRNHGGFGGAGRGPKFPQPVFIELLLQARRASADEATTRAIDAAVRTTLDQMAIGGLFDQVGGGFHRYSVDATWTVPHFEKMLYDNAQLAEVYAKAAVVYDDEFYRRTAKRALQYVLREMTDPTSGAFFSAQDAEVNHREGQNYLWTRDQLTEALGREEGAWAAKVYAVERGPNFRDPHHPTEPPSNVLRLMARPEQVAAEMGMELGAMLARLDEVNSRLHVVRGERDQPGLDDKSIAGWNGLMISALAVAGALLNEPQYIEAGRRAATFVLSAMARDGGLLRTHRAGLAQIPAFLDDYAMIVRGLIELHRAGVDADGSLLAAAIELADQADRHFGAPDGGFFDTRAGQSDLFVRTRSVYDGALPSGAGMLLLDLIDLAEITGSARYRDRAIAALVGFSGAIAGGAAASVNSIRALLRVLATARPALAAALEAAGARAAAPDEASPDARDVVEILAATDRVALSESRPASLTIRVKIADGYHITAADPGPTQRTVGLAPFRVSIINGSGVAVYADYPAGQPLSEGHELLVYSGTFDLTLAFERSGEWKGTPLVAVRYQACTDDACLAAQVVELDVALDPE